MHHNLSKILKDTFPMFADTFPGKVVELVNPKPLYPTRVKFTYNPNEVQALYPGLHFVIPNNINPNEILLLDKRLVENNFSDVKVPKRIYNKFEKAGRPKTKYKAFNYFKPEDGVLKVSKVKCFITPPILMGTLPVTDLQNPEYGTISDLNTCALLLQIIIMLMRFLDSEEGITSENMDIIVNNVNKLRKLYKDTDLTFGYKDTDIGLYIDTVYIEGFSRQNLDYLQNFVCSFHNLFVDINDFMGW